MLIVPTNTAAIGSQGKDNCSTFFVVQSGKLTFAPQNLYPRLVPSPGIFYSSFLFFVMLFLFLACDSPNFEAQLNQAKKYRTQGYLEEAEQLLTEVIQTNESFTEAFLLRGQIRESNSEFEKAISDYSAIIDQDSQITQAWSSRGSCYYRIGAFQNALQDFSRAIELEPNNADLYLYLGNSYGEMDMFTEAIKNFNVAREISFGDYYSNLTKAYEDIHSRKYTSALARATSAIEENPTDPIPHSYKGISLYHLGKFNDAILHLNTATKLDPGNSATIYNLGLAYMASKNTGEAVSQFEKAMSIDPSLKRDIDLAGALESE